MQNVFSSSRAGLAVTALSVTLLAGCASTSNPNDPLESYNRAMFSFNEQLDKVAIKPAAQVYEAVLPSPVRTGVGNVLGNLGARGSRSTTCCRASLPRA
jgi:phospholipid-binding lipoprotein MlaA